MGSTQELSCARADADRWLTPPGRSICTYQLERLDQWFCVLRDPEMRTHYEGHGSTEAEAIEAALAAARGNHAR